MPSTPASPATPTIRRLVRDDLDAAIALRRRALANDPDAFGASFRPADDYVRRFSARIATAFDADDDFVIGAFDGLDLCGMVGCQRLDGVKARHRAAVWGMYVDGALRGRGLGRRLVEEVIARARVVDGLAILELTVVADNASARGLYDRLGFVAWGVQRGAIVWQGRRADEAHLALDLRARSTP
jgi:ribosomal protein S18 acetylase RimI-like enzyme